MIFDLPPLLFIDIMDRSLFLEIIIIKSTGFVQLSEWLLNFDGKFMFFASGKKAVEANIRWITNSLKLSGTMSNQEKLL